MNFPPNFYQESKPESDVSDVRLPKLQCGNSHHLFIARADLRTTTKTILCHLNPDGKTEFPPPFLTLKLSHGKLPVAIKEVSCSAMEIFLRDFPDAKKEAMVMMKMLLAMTVKRLTFMMVMMVMMTMVVMMMMMMLMMVVIMIMMMMMILVAVSLKRLTLMMIVVRMMMMMVMTIVVMIIDHDFDDHDDDDNSDNDDDDDDDVEA